MAAIDIIPSRSDDACKSGQTGCGADLRPPGPDCIPYHNRQPVILERDQWATWLDLTTDPAPCLKAGLEGVVTVEPALDTGGAG